MTRPRPLDAFGCVQSRHGAAAKQKPKSRTGIEREFTSAIVVSGQWLSQDGILFSGKLIIAAINLAERV